MFNLRNNFFNILKQKRKYYSLILFGKIEKILKTTAAKLLSHFSRVRLCATA